MNIKEIKTFKKEIEQKIFCLINDFSEKTECIVSEISFSVEVRNDIICLSGVSLTVKIL